MWILWGCQIQNMSGEQFAAFIIFMLTVSAGLLLLIDDHDHNDPRNKCREDPATRVEAVPRRHLPSRIVRPIPPRKPARRGGRDGQRRAAINEQMKRYY